MTRRYCDKCGDEMSKESNIVGYDCSIAGKMHSDRFEICDKCMDKLKAELYGWALRKRRREEGQE